MTTPTEATGVEQRASVRAARRAFSRSPEGAFAKAMRGAMDEFKQMRAEGISFEDAVRGLEVVLRDVWPMRPSRFTPCASCDDTGYREAFCTDSLRCARYRCGLAESEWEHAYVVPCDCPFGEKFRERAHSSEDHLAAVGRRKKSKPKGWSPPGT